MGLGGSSSVTCEALLSACENHGGDLAKAAAIYDECAHLWGVSKGADHARTQGAQAEAARVRAAAVRGGRRGHG